jgi:hypothetical protein
MAQHLMIISKLLSMKAPTGDKEKHKRTMILSLQKHVVATCFTKISHRLRQAASKSFIKSLKSVTTWEFDEKNRGQPSTKETGNDREFAAYLLTIKGKSFGNIPALIAQAELVKNGTDQRLYTEESFTEFHTMLLDLIDDFRVSLITLGDLVKGKDVPTIGTEAFRKEVVRTAVFGYMLQKLAKGAALRMHLNTIAPLLINWDDYHSQMPMSPGENPSERDVGLETDVEETEDMEETEDVQEPDLDIELVNEARRKGDALATTYLDWLRLLVAHFDAISVLVGYVTGPEFKYDAISIEMVVDQHVDLDILPWRTLFSNPKLFPTTSTEDARFNEINYATTNAEILNFLNEALETLPQIESARSAWDKGDKVTTIECFKKLKTSKVKSWEKCAEEMLVKLGNDSPSDVITTEITTKFQSLRKSTAIFDALAKDEKFKGALHCEALLASLLTKTPHDASEDILEQMKASQLSDLFLSPGSHFL